MLASGSIQNIDEGLCQFISRPIGADSKAAASAFVTLMTVQATSANSMQFERQAELSALLNLQLCCNHTGGWSPYNCDIQTINGGTSSRT